MAAISMPCLESVVSQSALPISLAACNKLSQARAGLDSRAWSCLPFTINNVLEMLPDNRRVAYLHSGQEDADDLISDLQAALQQIAY